MPLKTKTIREILESTEVLKSLSSSSWALWSGDNQGLGPLQPLKSLKKPLDLADFVHQQATSAPPHAPIRRFRIQMSKI